MYKHYIPSWICCLNASVLILIWTNWWTCPGWIFIRHKHHPFGNEYHTITDGLTNILFRMEIAQGKDAQNIPVEFDDSERTVGLLVCLTRGNWGSERVIILDSGFWALQGIIDLMKKGVFSSVLIKKHQHWPSLINGYLLDKKLIHAVTSTRSSIKGTLDNFKYTIFCLKEPLTGYANSCLYTRYGLYGDLYPPDHKRKETARTCDDGLVVQFVYKEPLSNHFDFRYYVDDNNNLRHHSNPLLKETGWMSHWVLWV